MKDDAAMQPQLDDTLESATAFLDQPAEGAITPERMAEVQALGERVTEALRTVYDPEIPVNIYELGLVYKIDIEDDNSVNVVMTLTSPHCPVAETMPGEVEEKIQAVEGVTDAKVEITWDPPWHPSLMSEEAQLELGMGF